MECKHEKAGGNASRKTTLCSFWFGTCHATRMSCISYWWGNSFPWLWIPNECIVAVYDASQRDFYHFNRAYSLYRKHYNEQINIATMQVLRPLKPANWQCWMVSPLKMFTEFCEGVGRGKLRSQAKKDQLHVSFGRQKPNKVVKMRRSKAMLEHLSWECHMFHRWEQMPPRRDGRKVNHHREPRDHAINRSDQDQNSLEKMHEVWSNVHRRASQVFPMQGYPGRSNDHPTGDRDRT